MNKNKADQALHDRISAGLSQRADSIDGRMQARLRRARVSAVSVDHDLSWSARLWQIVSVPAVMRMPVAQASVAILVAVFSISLLLTPGSPIISPAINSAGGNISHVSKVADINNVDAALQNNGAQSGHSLNEMDVLMSNEDMEFLENLEIYEWLVAEYG